MKSLPKYRYVEEQSEGNLPIQIIDGKFEGIVVRYGKLYLEQREDEVRYDYDFDIIENPDNHEVDDDELKEILGSIIFSILEEQLGNLPENMNLLSEDSDSEEHRESNTPKSDIQ